MFASPVYICIWLCYVYTHFLALQVYWLNFPTPSSKCSHPHICRLVWNSTLFNSQKPIFLTHAKWPVINAGTGGWTISRTICPSMSWSRGGTLPCSRLEATIATCFLAGCPWLPLGPHSINWKNGKEIIYICMLCRTQNMCNLWDLDCSSSCQWAWEFTKEQWTRLLMLSYFFLG